MRKDKRDKVLAMLAAMALAHTLAGCSSEQPEAGTVPESGLEEGLWSVAVGVAAELSIEENRFVEMDEVMACSGVEDD